MFRFSKIIFLVLICFGLTVAQVFDTKGKPHAKVANRSSKPKTIIDTVKIVAGYGTMKLNSRFTRSTHNVTATKKSRMYATISPMMVDTTMAVYYYGYVRAKDGKSLTIKSSGGALDTGYVVVNLFIK